MSSRNNRTSSSSSTQQRRRTPQEPPATSPPPDAYSTAASAAASAQAKQLQQQRQQQQRQQSLSPKPPTTTSMMQNPPGGAPRNSSGAQQQHHHHQQPQRVHHSLHQPHGASAIGPSPSTVSSSSYSPHQQQYNQGANIPVSLESPLPPMVQRGLGDRSNDKRKNAALEIEALIKSLQEAHNITVIQSVVQVLSRDFCTSMNSNYRKGGLVGLAATAIGLQIGGVPRFLELLLPPILHCFDDPEARVRYYACESLYNVAKVARQSILTYFNPIFEGLAKLFADVDVDVKNGANLLDRLIKDIVIEAETFQVEIFLPLLQTYIRRTNPYIRQLIVGWITLLDSIPDISMLDYLPDFLDGLFNMLSDTNREIRQAADSALSEFLREVSLTQVLELGPLVGILVVQCRSSERLVRLTAITWLAEVVNHTKSGGDILLKQNHAPSILRAILCCISDGEKEIRYVAERTNNDLLKLVQNTKIRFELKPLLETLTSELTSKEDVPTKMASLKWINMLMEKLPSEMNQFTSQPLLPVLLRTLSDPSDTVVLLDLQVLSRISLATSTQDASNPAATKKSAKEAQFQLVLNAILNLFAQDRQLLETRGSLVIRKLCVLLNAKSVYIRMAETLCSYEPTDVGKADFKTLQFISTMVQTLNLILLTASELHDLRFLLAGSMLPIEMQTTQHQAQLHQQSNKQLQRHYNNRRGPASSSPAWKGSGGVGGIIGDDDDDLSGSRVFERLFKCWCHNPVATFSLCLLAQAYDLSFALVRRFSSQPNVSVGFLMQIDKLVHLLESPIFVHLRLQLLQVEAPYHASLLKSIYGILMCLPQGDAFRLLNERLTTVCNLRENLGLTSLSVNPNVGLIDSGGEPGAGEGIAGVGAMNSTVPTTRRGGNKHKQQQTLFEVDVEELLNRYDTVTEQHRHAEERATKLSQEKQQQLDMQLLRPESAATVLSGSAGGAAAAAAASQQQQQSQQQPQPQYTSYGMAQTSSSSSSFGRGGAGSGSDRERGGGGEQQQQRGGNNSEREKSSTNSSTHGAADSNSSNSSHSRPQQQQKQHIATATATTTTTTTAGHLLSSSPRTTSSGPSPTSSVLPQKDIGAPSGMILSSSASPSANTNNTATTARVPTTTTTSRDFVP